MALLYCISVITLLQERYTVLFAALYQYNAIKVETVTSGAC